MFGFGTRELIVIVIILVIPVSLAVALTISSRKERKRLADQGSDPGEYYGLAGWLILVAIHLIQMPIALWFKLQEGSAAKEALPDFGWYLNFQIVGAWLFMAASIAVAVLFFRKSSRFPSSYIYLLLATVFFTIIDFTFAVSVAGIEPKPLLPEAVSGVIIAAIWITYISRSKRVAATFIR